MILARQDWFLCELTYFTFVVFLYDYEMGNSYRNMALN